MPLSLNEMAKQMAKCNGGPIAWAFKVEALEQPRMFQVIQPGSDRAEDLLRRALASQPRLTTPIAGEQAIKNAVKGLTRKVKPEALLVLDNALENPAIDERFWEGIFNGQGADKARSQGLYSEQMVKLLTLRGMILPETLPEFVQWMKARSGKQKEHWEICSHFQSEICSYFQSEVLIESNQLLQLRNCRENAVRGVRSLIPRVINKPELVSAVVWFLASSQRIWGYWYKEKVRDEIENDLSLMSQFVRQKNNNLDFQTTQDQSWKKILEDIAIFWQIQANPRKKFEPLADLFSQLRNPKIAALFYQICFHAVPKEIVFELRSRGYHSEVYGIHINREVGIFEQLSNFILKLGEIIMPLPYVIFLMIFMLSGGFFAGAQLTKIEPTEQYTNQRKTSSTYRQNSQNNFEQDNFKNSQSQTSTNSNISNNEIDTKILANANKKFDLTIQNLTALINELKVESNLPENEIVQELKQVLKAEQSDSLDYATAKTGNIQEKNKWIKAIYNYQLTREFLSPDGVINTNKDTSNTLKCDVAKRLDITFPNQDKICYSKNQNTNLQNAPGGEG
ncbi:MAG: hypothetical protein J7647_21285 [Cyanobacteria bacterium SBLK]|nr:hypothetical protein [Cyanobacteria bacterium SBLK]